jgi:hypothetical protein
VELPLDFSNDVNLEFNIRHLDDGNNEKQNWKREKIL